MAGIKIVDLQDAEIDEGHGVVTRRIIRAADGAESMSFGFSTMPEGLNAPAISYPDHDEIVYVLTGRVEVTIAGDTHLLDKGKTIFIPRGETYGYRVLEGPNDVVVTFAPVRY
jgi:quercetin dioxygenase-like cupin family protein